MRTGQSFRLKTATLAIDNSRTKPTAVSVPADTIIYVTDLRNPRDPRMIEVEWQGGALFMFEIDIQDRGERITETAELSRVHCAGT